MSSSTTTPLSFRPDEHVWNVMCLEQRWLGRQVCGSTAPTREAPARGRRDFRGLRKVTRIWYSAEDGMYVADADEHHRARTPEALDRRLWSLAPSA